MVDQKRNERVVLGGGPARYLKLVTKSDGLQSPPLLSLRVAIQSADAPATLKITDFGGNDVTLNYPVAGVYWEPAGATRVWLSGSTANAVVHGVPAS